MWNQIQYTSEALPNEKPVERYWDERIALMSLQYVVVFRFQPYS